MSVTFKRPNNKDTGVLKDSESIQPVTNGELITEDNLGRPSDNLRVRTEELARAIESLEYIVQSANNSSVLLRHINTSDQLQAGTLKIYSKTVNSKNYYYIIPEVPTNVTGTKPTLIVVGNATNGFSYLLDSVAFSTFYDQGDSITDNHNPYLGMSDPGDCIALRIPTVPSDYSGEVMLPNTSSSLLPAGSAFLSDSLYNSVLNSSLTGNAARHSLLKIPSKNSITVSNFDSTLETQLENYFQDVGVGNEASTLELIAYDSQNAEIGRCFLDTQGILKEGNAYILPKSGYLDLEDLRGDSVDRYEFSIGAGQPATYSSTVVVNSSTLLPKNEYLYPVATFTGDSVLVQGLGGVNLIDIETRGGEAIIDQSGVLIGETGTAVRVFETRTNISYEYLASNLSTELITTDTNWNEYFRLPIDVLVPEAGAGQELYLDGLELNFVSELSQEVVPRDVLFSAGLYNLASDITQLSSDGVNFSIYKCVLENSEYGLTRSIIRNFPISTLQDDYSAHIEIPSNLRNTDSSSKTILIWLYPSSNTAEFFDPSDTNTFNLDIRLKWTTRVPDSTNLARQESMDILNNA